MSDRHDLGRLPTRKTVERGFLERRAAAAGRDVNPEMGRNSGRRLNRLTPGSLPSPQELAGHLARRTGRQLAAYGTAVQQTFRPALSPTGQPAPTLDRHSAVDPMSDRPVIPSGAETRRPDLGPGPLATTLQNEWRRPLAGPTMAIELLRNLVHTASERSPGVGERAIPPADRLNRESSGPPALEQPRPAPLARGTHFDSTAEPAPPPTLLPHRSGLDDFSAHTWLGSPAAAPAETRANGAVPLPPATVNLNDERSLPTAPAGDDLIELAENVKRILDEEARRFGIDV